MHVSSHRLLLPALAPSPPAPKAHSEPTEFSEMAGVAEDLKIGGGRGRRAQRDRQKRPDQSDNEGAASEAVENRASMVAVSSPATMASFDFTRLAQARSESVSEPASFDDPAKNSLQKGLAAAPSLDDLLSFVSSAE